MTLRALILVLLVCSLLVGNNGVQGSRKLSREEELDFEKQLKLLNKPAVKTIRTEYGDIYDCVDFYKQPAFDHPLMKNHTFHYKMRPTSRPEWTRDTESSSTGSKQLNIGLKGGGCPVGTVPIRRTTKDDLIRAKLFSERVASNTNPLTAEKPGTHYAVSRTKSDANKKYNGIGATISIHNPHVMAFQYSSGQIKIQNGPDSIQVGWTVNPNIYEDNRTRLFTFLNAGESHCFNTQCPGFIIVDQEIPMGMVLEPVSTKGGPTYVWNFFIYRENPSGNWWLELGSNRTKVGFWPKKIFTGLADLGTYVEWGGEVFSLQDEPSPPMGGGDFPKEDTRVDAFCSNNVVVNEANEIVMEEGENTENYRDGYYYRVIDEGDIGGNFGYLVLYGGPGGVTGV